MNRAQACAGIVLALVAAAMGCGGKVVLDPQGGGGTSAGWPAGVGGACMQVCGESVACDLCDQVNGCTEPSTDCGFDCSEAAELNGQFGCSAAFDAYTACMLALPPTCDCVCEREAGAYLACIGINDDGACGGIL